MQPRLALQLSLAAAILPLAGCNPVVGNRTSGNGADEGNGLAAVPVAQPVPPARPAPPAASQGNIQLTEADGDALVPGTGFNATATIRCVTRAGRAARDCNAGVVRNRDGSAVVTIFSTEGQSRAISFDPRQQVTRVGTDVGDTRFAARRGARMTIVTLGGERYDIPDIMVTGD